MASQYFQAISMPSSQFTADAALFTGSLNN